MENKSRITEEDAKMSPLMRFRQTKRKIYQAPDKSFDIHAGDIFEAQTVKGHTNLIVALRNFIDPTNNSLWILYLHGGNAKKTPMLGFVRAVESGDLQLRSPFEIDTERLALSDIYFEAFCNSRRFEEQIDLNEEEMAAYISGVPLNQVAGDRMEVP